jgi:cytochrome c oxidase assembly protein subunit 15
MNSVSDKNLEQPALGRRPHKIAVLLTICVFPLIWLGATVTTYAAGMAVPDWPGTYGYNMFLYPISTWLFGPFNLLVEHGHRLLASLAGLITIVLVIETMKFEPRKSVQWFAWGLLGLILFQGVLGGARVLLDARTLARIHGCVGPMFFALAVGFCVVTSRWWMGNFELKASSVNSNSRSSYTSFALTMLVLSYIQLCIGSFLRHVTLDSRPTGFQHLVLLHLVTACLVVAGTLFHWIRSRHGIYAGIGVRGSINWLLGLVLVQFCLGLATWVVKYGWPVWFANWDWAARFVIEQKSMLQANIITGHVAVGSLIVAFWMIQFLRSYLAVGRTRWLPNPMLDGLIEMPQTDSRTMVTN